MIGGRDIRDLPGTIIADEPGHAADFANTSLVEHQFDALSASQLAATALAQDARILGAGRKAPVRLVLQRSDVRNCRCPSVVAVNSRLASRRRFALRLDGRDDL